MYNLEEIKKIGKQIKSFDKLIKEADKIAKNQSGLGSSFIENIIENINYLINLDIKEFSSYEQVTNYLILELITTNAKNSLIELEVFKILNTQETPLSNMLKKLNDIYKITEKEYSFDNENADRTLKEVTKTAFSKEIYEGSALNHIKLLLISYLSEYYYLMYLVYFLLLLGETENTIEILGIDNSIKKHENQAVKIKESNFEIEIINILSKIDRRKLIESNKRNNKLDLISDEDNVN